MRPPMLAAPLLLFSAALGLGDEVDDLVRERMAREKIPGLTLAVVRGGKVVRSAGYGVASAELPAPATADTVYEIGSITKPFTAMLVLMLVEEGKVKLDESVTTYVPKLPEAWKPVTVKHLLNHTSGLPIYTAATDFLKLAREEHTRAQILKLVADKPPEFPPGTAWKYNNTGYFLLGMLIEEVTGRTYGEIIKDRITGPLKMDATRPDNPRAVVAGRARGHGLLLGTTVNRDPITTSSSFAAGCLLSTVGDLAKYDAALKEGRFLKPSSYEIMYDTTKLPGGKSHPYGFGWITETTDGKRLYAHDGGTPGFATALHRHVDDDLTVIVLTNLADARAGGIAEAVARQVVSPPAAKPSKDDDPALTARHKAMFAQVLEGKVEAETFTPKMAEFLKTAAPQQIMKEIAAEGKSGSFDLLQRVAEGGTKSVYRAAVGPSAYRITVHADEAGKVDGLLAQKED